MTESSKAWSASPAAEPPTHHASSTICRGQDLSFYGQTAQPPIVADPSSLLLFETRKILVRPSGNEDPTFGGAEWSDSTPKLVQTKIIQSFENAGLAVARSSENVTADNQLFLDLRKFQLSASAARSAEVEFGAKVVSANGRLLGTRIFECSSAAKSVNAAGTVDALNEAFGKCATQLVQWTTNLIR